MLPLVPILIIAGCGHSEINRKPAAASSRVEGPALTTADRDIPPTYVGNEECKECHLRAFTLHKASRHDATLLSADIVSLGSLAPPIGRISGTPYIVTQSGNKLYFGLANNPKFQQPLDVAFGSGKSGLTFASYIHSSDPAATSEDEGLLRVRMSWFPKSRKWFVTPSDENLRPRDPPNALMGEHGRACITCHVVKLDDVSIVPEDKFYGVGCEACHGPASSHVAAARTKGATDLKIRKLASLSSREQFAICGTCHGMPETSRPKPGMQISAREAALHPPAGLTYSACFIKSGERLSCLTCHDSHTDVRTDATHYEAVCRSCHNSGAGQVPSVGNGSATRENPASGQNVPPGESVVCPVQPSGHCLSCHMPTSKVFLGGGRGTDHCIRRFRTKDSVPGLTANLKGAMQPAP